MRSSPAPNSIQPSGWQPKNSNGRSIGAPDFFRHSMAHQTRVAAMLASSPLSRAMSSANAKPSAPSRSRQISGERTDTSSRSHPATAPPATATTRSPAWDADTRCPLTSGRPSDRRLTLARKPRGLLDRAPRRAVLPHARRRCPRQETFRGSFVPDTDPATAHSTEVCAWRRRRSAAGGLANARPARHEALVTSRS